jgi:nucleotide-binding universal stress UspA family protein
MSFSDPLVILRPYPASTPDAAVDQAVEIAASVSTRVSVIACGVVHRVPRSILGDSLLSVSSLVGEEKHKSATDVQRLLSRFTDQVGKKANLAMGDGIAVMRPASEVPDVLAAHARLYDLSIVPMPTEDNNVARLDAQWHLETIVFGSGHPTIVVPEGDRDTAATLDTIIVAWDNSRTAARAIADAMPILHAAKQVRLLTILGEKEIRFPQSGAELGRHLARHGITSVVDQVEARGEPIGEVLRRQVTTHGGDLLVMGAYGHSRIREFILGGATKAMLTDPPVTLFMSH